jgi:hypothetical protein
MSPAPRATQADPVARMLLAGSRLSAPHVMEWEARCGGFGVLPCRCTVTVGRRPGVSQLPRGFVNRLLPTVPKHPMQSLWHAIEPEFLALGVAPVSQDRRRGAGSNPVSAASLPPPPPLHPAHPRSLPPASCSRPFSAELACAMRVDYTAFPCGASLPRIGRGLCRDGSSHRGIGRP